MQLDPIKNWTSNQPFATLGNINFSSALLGLSNVLMVGKLLNEKTPQSHKFYVSILILLNISIILYSESIQGIAIWLVGSSILFFAKIKKRANKNSIKQQKIFENSYFPILILIGLFIFAGTAGIGPLGSQLTQQTIRYRIDYWSAGFGMSVRNLWSGVGVDSYGDFYREFRSPQATVGNHGRITNTAHNVLLDIFSGGGIFLLVSFILILGLAFVRISRVLS